MTRMTFTEFMKHAKAYFDSVEQGGTIQVMRHGEVIGRGHSPEQELGSESMEKTKA